MAEWWLVEQHEVDLTSSRMRTQRTLLPKAGGEPRREAHDLRLYAAHEVRALCRQAGLEVTDQFGGLDGARLTRESWRLITVARRPAR